MRWIDRIMAGTIIASLVIEEFAEEVSSVGPNQANQATTRTGRVYQGEVTDINEITKL